MSGKFADVLPRCFRIRAGIMQARITKKLVDRTKPGDTDLWIRAPI